MVGEHRCGNTSILYQMLNSEVCNRYLGQGEIDELTFAFVNAQLAAEGPEYFYRRIARALRRADSDSEAEFDDLIDQAWLEDYLDDLGYRGQRLVLLLDEFEVLADFEAGFWEWFRGLITEYDVSIVVATRVELGQFRDEWGIGSPFFNMFRSVYVGSFTEADVSAFLSGTGEAAGVDFTPVREEIESLAGRFPYFLQVAASLFYEHARREDVTGSAEQIAAVRRDFRVRTELHFEDIWSRLPEQERDALAWMAVGATPDAREALGFNQALPSLERRGYAVEGRIFSQSFTEYVRRQIQRVELNPETGEVRIEKRPVDLPPKEFALLRFFLEKQGEVVSKSSRYSGSSSRSRARWSARMRLRARFGPSTTSTPLASPMR
jgi:serine/threonine-protein kinase